MIKAFIVRCWWLLLITACQTHQQQASLRFSLDEHYLLSTYQQLSSEQFSGRKVGTFSSRLAQQYLIQQMQSLGLTPFNGSYFHQFSFTNLTGEQITAGNLVAELRGNSNSQQFIVLTAHMDHLGQQGSHIYYGADDNASGCSALLAIIKKLSILPEQLKHNILVIFTDGEESGLKGAKAFLQQNPQLVPNIKLNINLDMLAGSADSRYLHYLSRNLNKILNKQHLATFKQQQAYQGFPVLYGFKRHLIYKNKHVRWLKASDHYAFHRQGIPFIYYGVGVHNNYHTRRDTFENSNKILLIQSANTIYHQLLLLDQLI